MTKLKTKNYVISINNQNITKYPHNNVIKIIKISTETLTLQITKNYNNSESSNDEYHHKNKTKYPNKIRPRHASNRHKKKILTKYNQKNKHTHNKYKHKNPH